MSVLSDAVFCVVQRRQLAASSGAFNLRDKVFCDLFGEVAEVSVREVICRTAQ